MSHVLMDSIDSNNGDTYFGAFSGLGTVTGIFLSGSMKSGVLMGIVVISLLVWFL